MCVKPRGGSARLEACGRQLEGTVSLENNGPSSSTSSQISPKRPRAINQNGLKRILNPSFLSQMASDDVAADICQEAISGGVHDTRSRHGDGGVAGARHVHARQLGKHRQGLEVNYGSAFAVTVAWEVRGESVTVRGDRRGTIVERRGCYAGATRMFKTNIVYVIKNDKSQW